MRQVWQERKGVTMNEGSQKEKKIKRGRKECNCDRVSEKGRILQSFLIVAKSLEPIDKKRL